MKKANVPVRVAVAGGGSWGTALAHILAVRGHKVQMLVRDAVVAQSISHQRCNPRYLAGFTLAAGIDATTDMTVLAMCDVLVLAVPCQQLRMWLRTARPFLSPACTIVNAAKGIEQSSMCTVSHIVAQELGAISPAYAILSGPSFAAEVVQGQPTAVVLGCADAAVGVWLREIFSSETFRCYSSTDVVGVELGGALKNIMAIGAGLCDGLGLGHNSRAALITRGLAEMQRIGVVFGAQQATFMGLSGLGDLTLTCTGDLSRNRQVGVRLGRGESLEQIVTSLGMVAEGVKTTQAAYDLSLQRHIVAPITSVVQQILCGACTAREGLTALMNRKLKDE